MRVALGLTANASGINAVALGSNTNAGSYCNTAIGRNNIGGGTTGSWVHTDPLLEIGKGMATKSNGKLK